MTTRVPILLYHSVAEEASPQFRRWVVRPQAFAAHMAYLHDHGYTPMTVTQLVQAMVEGSSRLPELPVVITFDDGLADFHTHALPALTALGFPATLYIVAGFIGSTSQWLSRSSEGTRPMLTWAQLAEITASGVECGAHTMSHPQLDILSPATAQDEVARSKWILEQRLGRQIDSFAYPHGYYSTTVRRFVQQAGYSSACAVKHAFSDMSDDRFALARLIVTDTATTDAGTIEDFAQLLTGQGLRVAPARERVRTKGWRVARRTAAALERHRHRGMDVAGDDEHLDEAAQLRAARSERQISLPVPSGVRAATAGRQRSGMRTVAPQQRGQLPDTPAQVQEQAPPLLVHNLLNTVEPLAQLLLSEARQGSWLNAYLLAAGMNQIVEDYLHPDPFFLGKAATLLARVPPPLGSAAASTARAIAGALAKAQSLSPTARRLRSRQALLAALVLRLAELAVCQAGMPLPGKAGGPDSGNQPGGASADDVMRSGETLLTSLRTWPRRLLQDVIRLPSSFRSFDQQPSDIERIVQDFTRRWPDRSRAMVVVGVRTSGSYLAPLYAAFLKAHGYQHVQTLTIRPGRRLLAAEHEVLQVGNQQGALVLLTDDPPSSGETIAEAAHALERVGVPAEALVLLLQVFEDRATVPPSLQRYTAVLLPWEAWAIHQQLAPRAVESTLARLIAPAREVCSVERLALPPQRSVRGHVQSLYSVRLMDRRSGQQQEKKILVEGIGLGYFGEHALAVERTLRPFLPAVYGVQDGLLYRAWVPEDHAIQALEPSSMTTMVEYIVARHRALPVGQDMSMRLFGRMPVWEVASNLVSQAFGRGWRVVRVPVIDPLVRHIVRCPRPSVIDGSMIPSHCFFQQSDGLRLAKVDFAGSAFTNRDLACYDPVFDLASLAASFDLAGQSVSEQDTMVPRHLRAAYERRSGEAIGEERWLLYHLVHFWDRQRLQGDRVEIRRARARALQRYFSAILFTDVSASIRGDLCALDIDGVLESEVLGFPGMTLASATALRALLLHGYRPVLVTGRSLDEVRERCTAFHLAGGVAEYGAVVYDHGTGRVRQLLSASDRQALERLRETLGALPGVYLDPDYQHAVRAFQRDAAGHRRHLGPAVIARALAMTTDAQQVRAIAGEAQTDFMVTGIDKGIGLRALAEDLGVRRSARDGNLVALAVGDTVSDLPMLALASMGFSPANADGAVRAAGVTVLKHAYQRGMALAAGQLLHHAPGSCPACRAPRLSPQARLLLMILDAQQAGAWGMVRQAAVLAARVWADLLVETLTTGSGRAAGARPGGARSYGTPARGG